MGWTGCLAFLVSGIRSVLTGWISGRARGHWKGDPDRRANNIHLRIALFPLGWIRHQVVDPAEHAVPHQHHPLDQGQHQQQQLTQHRHLCATQNTTIYYIELNATCSLEKLSYHCLLQQEYIYIYIYRYTYTCMPISGWLVASQVQQSLYTYIYLYL